MKTQVAKFMSIKLNSSSGAVQTSIHPNPQPRARLLRKKRAHEENHKNRSETNRQRSNNKANPTWHGIGKHAGVREGH
jgi:hypothetical protein